MNANHLTENNHKHNSNATDTHYDKFVKNVSFA